MRPKLRDGTYAVDLDEGLYLSCGAHQAIIRGNLRVRQLEAVAKVLDGLHSLSDVIGVGGPRAQGLIELLVRRLEESGFVYDAERDAYLDPEVVSSSAEVLTLLEAESDLPRTALLRYRNSDVTVAGEARPIEAFLRTSAGFGLARVRVIDRTPDLHAALSSRLGDLLVVDRGFDELEGPTSSGVLVLLNSEYDTDAGRSLAVDWYDKDRAVIVGGGFAGRMYLGPLTKARPCASCAANFLRRAHGGGRQRLPGAIHLCALGELAAWWWFSHVAALPTAPLVESIMEIDLADLTTTYHPLATSPLCERCRTTGLSSLKARGEPFTWGRTRGVSDDVFGVLQFDEDSQSQVPVPQMQIRVPFTAVGKEVDYKVQVADENADRLRARAAVIGLSIYARSISEQLLQQEKWRDWADGRDGPGTPAMSEVAIASDAATAVGLALVSLEGRSMVDGITQFGAARLLKDVLKDGSASTDRLLALSKMLALVGHVDIEISKGSSPSGLPLSILRVTSGRREVFLADWDFDRCLERACLELLSTFSDGLSEEGTVSGRYLWPSQVSWFGIGNDLYGEPEAWNRWLGEVGTVLGRRGLGLKVRQLHEVGPAWELGAVVASVGIGRV